MPRLSLIFLCALGFWTGCWSARPRDDSRSNWLRSCKKSADCGQGLRCSDSVCVLASSVAAAEPDAGKDGSAAGHDPGELDAGTDAGSSPRPDASTDGDAGPPVDARVDSGDSGSGDSGSATARHTVGGRCDSPSECAQGLLCDQHSCTFFSVPAGAPGNACLPASTTRAACGSNDECPRGLVCHTDDTCIEPGRCDETGVATLVNNDLLAEDEWNVLGGDDAFLYGYEASGNNVWIASWPIAGGVPSLLASRGVSRDAAGVVALAVGENKLYWLAVPDKIGATNELLELGKDGTSDPVDLGPAGTVLTQDADYLYFTDADNTHLLRSPKADPSTRETVYGLPGRFILSAVATDRDVYVGDSSNQGGSNSVLRKIDKATQARGDLALQPGVEPFWLSADANYVYFGASMEIYRVDFEHGDVQQIESGSTVSDGKPRGGEVIYSESILPDMLPHQLSAVTIDTGNVRQILTLGKGDTGWLRGLVVRPYAAFVHAGSRIVRVELH